MDFIRRIIAIFMTVLTPVSFFCLTGTKKGVNYTAYSYCEKEERKESEYKMSGYDIYVSKNGSDTGDGTESSPFATVERAVLKARENRACTVEPFTVWIGEGCYTFREPLRFTSEDADNVTYRAKAGEKVSFSGEAELSGWKETEVNGVRAWVADVPEGIDFNTLIKDDSVLPVTRYPESGYLTIETTDHSDGLFTEETTPWSLSYGDMAVVCPKNSGVEKLTMNENTVVKVLHYWCDDTSFFSRFDEKSGKLFVTKPFTMKVEKGDRFFLQNVFELLDSPGEWFFDKKNAKVFYIPFEGEQPDSVSVKACATTQLLDMEDMKNIRFEDITFKNTDWCYPELDTEGGMAFYGLKHPQAEYDSMGALRITRSEGIGFYNCDFLNIGNTAVKLDRVVKNSAIESCRFENIGANAVYIHGYNAVEPERITENITIRNNVIRGYGRSFADAIGVLITHARSCEISDNEISDGYYTAISVGWVWGYAYSVTCNNKIRDNLIYDIGQGWLSDMGGIYTLGIQEGTVISGNTIHNVAADSGEGGYGGWGIYLDEGSSCILVKNNLCYDCGSQGFHQHYGKNNTVTNNIFAMNRLGQVRASKREDHTALFLTGNIIVGEAAVFCNINGGRIFDSRNLFWDYKRGKNIVSSANESLDIKNIAYEPYMRLADFYKDAVIEDPLFKDAKNFDFNLPENSPAIQKIGFIPWDYTRAGCCTK